MYLKEIKSLLETELSPKIYKRDSEIYGIHYGSISDKKIIKKIMLTVFLTVESVLFALKNKINLIIAFHGMINKPIKAFSPPLIKKLNLLSKHPIIIFILNSSLIPAEGGVSETIMEALYFGLDQTFNVRDKNDTLIPLGRICTPNLYPNEKYPLKLENVLKRIKTNLQLKTISYVGELQKNVEKICIIGAASCTSKTIKALMRIECDCLISGGFTDNVANFGRELSISLINIPLYDSIFLTLRKMYNILTLRFPYDEFYLHDSKNPINHYF